MTDPIERVQAETRKRRKEAQARAGESKKRTTELRGPVGRNRRNYMAAMQTDEEIRTAVIRHGYVSGRKVA